MKPNISKRADGAGRLSNTSPVGPGSGPKPSGSAGSASRGTQAMTLVEMMVAVAVGSLLLMVVAVTFTSGTRAFAVTSNYVGMDCSSRQVLDHMSQEIRWAGNLVEFTTNHLKFGYRGATNYFLVYDWNAASGQLTEWNTSGTTTNVLLTGCDRLTFSLYDAAFVPTTFPSQGKGISVAWTASRTILGNKSTTEDMQQALIIIRNKAQ
jgi:prepilin-type N-terminal cleavage/methylation domain-containing protein